MQTPVPTVVMRGGTSRGLYFRPEHLPHDAAVRDRVLLAAMGSPHQRQIDGIGGSHPLTSKVAIVTPSREPLVDVDYLFLQVFVDEARVSDAQNCGNILAGVGPFALEQGMLPIDGDETDVRIRMLNTGGLTIARVQTPAGRVAYSGAARIDGVAGTAAPVSLDFQDLAGASCGSLLPSASARDSIHGVDVTCIDNGMPVVLLKSADLGKSGRETPAALEADMALREKLEAIRRSAGAMMKLGDVTDKTVPKLSLVSPPASGGTISTRTFIPHRVHDAIGVLGAVSVATACLIDGSVAAEVATAPGDRHPIQIEHPSGSFEVELEVAGTGNAVEIKRSALLRTARKIMQGDIYIPATVWDGRGLGRTTNRQLRTEKQR